MCDTIVVVNPDGVLFAKNSDRDANEAQILEWHEAETHPAGAELACTYLTIPQVKRTRAILISRPYWMWGAEIGTNECGVTIGNEAVFTDQPYADTGLTGMDLLRLGLERSATASEAVAVIVSLLETHGQGGGCGHEDRSFTYHNSFLIADTASAFVLETAGSEWASEPVRSGVRTISNGLTIPRFADAHADRLRGRVARCSVRSALTAGSAAGSTGVTQLASVLRSHGESEWPNYGLLTGSLSAPCMHAAGLLAGSVTTASWIADLKPGSVQHWATATSSPCLGLFKPIAVDSPLDLGVTPTDAPEPDSLWWRHEALSRMVMKDPDRLACFLADRDAVEAGWFEHAPPTSEAFVVADDLLEKWTSEVTGLATGVDTRPWWIRRYWQKHSA